MIDVIIPAYNCSDTLSRTLSALLTQTDQEFKVYIIDDCSDESLDDIITFFSNYLNIIYIKLEEHSGVPGEVRNIGIEKSDSEIITFCDADDFLAPNALEVFSKTFTDYPDTDYIVGYFYEQYHDGSIKIKNQTSTTWLHGNAYKREYLNKYNIRFPKQKLNEDGAFNSQVYLFSDNFKIINIPIYYWMYNDKSLTRTSRNDVDKTFEFISFKDLVDSLKYTYTHLFEVRGYDDKIIGNFASHIAMFHAKLCNLVYLYTTNNKKYKKVYDNSLESLKTFLVGFEINKIFNNPNFKKSFCQQYLQYKKPNVVLDLGSYFKLLGVNYSIKVEDFCNL